MPRAFTAVLLLVLTSLLAGCTDFSSQGPENRIGLVRIDVAAPVVSTGRVTLDVISTLDNLEAESGELNITVKAFDLATNMLVATRTVTVGQLDKDTTSEVTARLELARASGYRIEVFVGQDGRVVQRGQVEVSNVMALEPTIYDTGLRISQVEAEIGEVKTGRVKVDCSVYLTNEGGATSRPLRLQLKARELSTGILADEQWIDVAAIAADETRIGHVTLEMPDEFNYELLAALWDGNVIVETGQGKVQFLPTYTQDTSTKLVVTNPNISLFDRDEGVSARYSQDGDGFSQGGSYYGAPGSTTTQTPGLGLVAVLAAVATLALILRRRTA